MQNASMQLYSSFGLPSPST